MLYINALFLMIILAAIVLFIVDNVKKEDSEDGEIVELTQFNKIAGYVLIALIAVFVFLRIYGFGEVPGGVNQDGAMAAVDAKALADYGTDRFGTKLPAHLYAWGYGQMSSLMSYCMVPFIKLFGLNVITMRLPILLASLMGIAAFFFLFKKLFSKDAALIAALLVAVNPWHFMQSRWALDCNMFPHMFIIGLMFLVYGISRKRYVYISMIFFALCMYSYGVAFYMVPLFLLAAAIVLLVMKLIKIRQVILAIVIYFVVSLPIYITMLINAKGWDTISLPFVTMQSFPDSVRTNDMLFFSDTPVTQLFQNIKTTINLVFLQKPDLIWNSIDAFGTIYLCSIPLVFMGFVICLYKSIKEKEADKKAIYRLLVIYSVCAALVGVFINGVNVNRINIIFYANIIFMAVSIYHIVSWKKYSSAVFVVAYGVLSVLFIVNYFNTWEGQIEKCFYSDFMDALYYIEDMDYDKCYITPDTQYEGSVNVSEILTMFGLDIDAEYFQGKTNEFGGKSIPYHERYIFSNPTENKPALDDKVIYIIRSSAYNNYDFSEWVVDDFDDYYVITAE